MFYRRKSYIVNDGFVEDFNIHFNRTNLPNQLKHGARLIGRWMKPNGNGTTEIFAIWEYDSFADYEKVEARVRSDTAHLERIDDWYVRYGGREGVEGQILEARNDYIESTLLR